MSRGQNIVPNPSFETYSVCPNSNGQIEFAVPWTAPTTTSSTDYYNACASLYNVPNYPGGGFQNAHSGNAYAGLFFLGASSSNPNFREYLQIQLINPLVQDITYYVEFFVNLHDGNFISPCNNISANFSVTRPFSTSQFAILPLTPHIINSGNPIIDDRINWVKVSGCYIAQGGEEYITIGNFMDASNTQTTGTTSSSYYLVDDVLVEEITGSCATGINELSIDDVKLFPNPTKGSLKLIISNLKYREHLTIRITDVLGQEVKKVEYEEEIDVSNLNKGIYFLSVYEHDQLLTTKKVVKE